MAHSRGTSPLELTARFGVLLGLIVRAAGLWFRHWAAGRGWWPASPDSLAERQREFARRFVRVAVRYKGGLIKLGQVASLRVDVLDEGASDELARLQDRVDPHPVSEIRAQVERELGPLDDHFAHFEAEPIASASLGQVHAAKLLSGEGVAVKVLYPGVERSVAVDLAAARIALWGFDFLTVADLDQVYREIRESIQGEMDYVSEGRAAEEVARNLARDPEVAAGVKIPAIHWEATARRVLTMEYIEGVKINERDVLLARGQDVEALVRLATRAFLHMIFRDGFFHCDPHPGNLLVTPDGRLGILDFGMHKRIAPGTMHMLRENLLATVLRDPDRYVQAFLDADMIDPRDRAAVTEIAKLSFAPEAWNLTPKELAEMDVAAHVRRLRGHLKQVRSFRLPDGLVMWGRAVSLLMGLATELAPGIRPLEVFGPYVFAFLQGSGPDAPAAPGPDDDGARDAIASDGERILDPALGETGGA